MPQFGWQPQVRLPHSCLGTLRQVRPVGEGAHERDREPVAGRLADAGLVLHVVREVRQRVALRRAAFRRDFLVAAGEAHRLERQEVDLLGVVERELDDASDLLVVDAVDDRDHRDDVDAGVVKVLDRAQLDVEQVADAAMRVGGVADAVELQIRVTQARLGGGLREVEALGEFNAVGRGLHRVVADLARVAHGVEEVRRQRRLATGELHRHLALRLDGDGVVEHRLDVVPSQLVHETDLVGVHEARVAHHVAAVGEVDRQHRAAAVLDRAAAMVVQLLVVVGADVAAGEYLLEMLEERGVNRHHVFEVPVDRAVLDHDDLAVLLVDGRLDLADLFVEQGLERARAIEDRLARFTHAGRAQRVGLARPAQRGLGLLVRLQDRLVGPLGLHRRARIDLVELGEDVPDAVGGNRQTLLCVLNRRVHGAAPRMSAFSSQLSMKAITQTHH